MRHAVILAGGSGTRLWPLSRRARPKQFLRLFEGSSLLQLARRRLDGLFPPERICVVAPVDYLELIASELPDIPRKNLIGEPVGRDTANAIGLAANLIARRDPDATMAVFTSDHLIEPQDAFAAAISAGMNAAEQFPAGLVTFGITPTSPHVGYGYILRGEPVASGVHRVAQFREKPDRATAETYVARGDYYWNSGMFAWRASTILVELERNLPENARSLAELAGDWDRRSDADEQRAKFQALKRISIDFGVMERAADVLMVEMPCRWIDLGSWEAIAATRAPDAGGNACIASRVIVAEGRNNIVAGESDHLIVALGVEDLVIIHSPDATLVCRRDQAEKIKDLAGLREARFGAKYE